MGSLTVTFVLARYGGILLGEADRGWAVGLYGIYRALAHRRMFDYRFIPPV